MNNTLQHSPATQRGKPMGTESPQSWSEFAAQHLVSASLIHPLTTEEVCAVCESKRSAWSETACTSRRWTKHARPLER